MDRYKLVLSVLILCLCFQNANAEFELFNESEFVYYLLNNTDTVKVMDWSEYNQNWSSNINYHSEIPDDVDQIAFPGPAIRSVYLHPVQKYIKLNGTMYSDTKKPQPISGYVSGGHSFDRFIRTNIIDQNNELSCSFRCMWSDDQDSEDSSAEASIVTINVFTRYYNSTLWGDISDINISLSNYSGGYLILNLTDVDDSITAYTIIVESPNHTAYYERFDYLYTIKESESLYYYDMIAASSMSCQGIIPFGSNRFYLPFDTGYNISITLYSPFDKTTINYTNIYIENNEKNEYEGDKAYIGFCFGFIFAVYYLYRSV